MIRYVSADILAAQAQALVIPVNCRGVAGAGLALAARKHFPAWFNAYKHACQTGRLKSPGDLDLYRQDAQWLVSFATKGHWQEKSSLSAVEAGLMRLAELARRQPFESLAVPALGCGLGGLAWKSVRRLIEKRLTKLPCQVQAYLPPLRVIVAGSREVDDYALVCRALHASGFPLGEVVSGAARGVDRLGLRYALEQRLPFRLFPADWERLGKAAGYHRNTQMAAYADALVAVWDGTSHGTQHMIWLARRQGLLVYVHEI